MMALFVETVGIPHIAPPTAGDWKVLYEAHGRQVYYLALRLLGNPTQAEDATHDVFLKAFHGLAQFRGDANPRTWLFRITVNHCQNLLHSWHHRNVLAYADETVLDNASQQDSPLRVLEIKELGQRIQRTLNALPDEYRLLLLLIAADEFSYDDVAEIMELTPDAVRGKLYRARRAFAAEFPKTA